MATKNYISILSKIDTANRISQLTIGAVNKEVKTIAGVQSDDVSKTWGGYIKLTAKDQTTIGNTLQKMKLQQPSIILDEMNNFLIWKKPVCVDGKIHIARKYWFNPVENMGQLKLKSYLRNVKEGLFY